MGAGCMGERFRIAPGYEALLHEHGLRDLAAVFEWRSGERLDKAGLESWRQRWRIALRGRDGAEHILYLKRFDHPPLRRQWQRWRDGRPFDGSAGVEWANARELAKAGIRAVEPIAFGEQMVAVFERRSFILLRQAPGESLERWLPEHLPPPQRESNWLHRRRRLDGLARFVAAFHAAGFVHRDLYLSHVFIQDAQTGTRQAGDGFCLIDLQRVFRPRWRRRRWVVKDLAALDFSTPLQRVGRLERLRFLCRYARHCGRFGSARELARQVAAKARWMERRISRPTADG